MDLRLGLSPRAVRPASAARVWGGVLALLAGVVAALLAAPASWSDYPAAGDGTRLGPAQLTPYPPMLPLLIAVIAVAGMAGACQVAAARVSAVVAALAASQVAGIAVVAHRDWWNFAGADGASRHRAAAGSTVAVFMGAVAAVAVVVSVLLYRAGRGRPQRPRTAQVAASVIGGPVVAVLVPVLLCAHWNYTSFAAAGQFALWWSLPWGAGVVAAGTLRDSGARQAAVMSVLASALLALLCVAAPTMHGFGIRLPD
ncbi:hypothetical protein ACQP2F_13610 [Actinoplanes sp. CA-030573]|uniref:hypothetical protein n=1 Tax=Actinoplanes sp. CA-030573 TaxID=3239898 RepID=UPI003D8FDB2D